MNNLDKTEEKINKFFNRFSLFSKLLIVLFLLISFVFNMIFSAKIVKLKSDNEILQITYNEDIRRAKEQYSLLYAQNISLNKRVQDLNLELIKTINNTVDLQIIFQQIYDESITLFSIKDDLNEGIEKTNVQLKKLQTSIEDIIETKQSILDSTEIDILKEKSKI